MKIIAAHQVFESIHPFFDGNGRTGRTLMSFELSPEEDIISCPMLPVSRYLWENRKTYYRRLSDVDKNRAWMDWFLFMLEIVERTAEGTLGFVNRFSCEYHRAVKLCAFEGVPEVSVEVAFERPYFLPSRFEGRCDKRIKAEPCLKALEKYCIVRPVEIAGRTVYENRHLTELLKSW